MLQLCTVYNSFVLSVQCYRVKCRMCTNTLANFVQSYYYTQRKKTKPTKKGEGAALTTAQDKLRNVDNEAAARREAYEKQAEVEKQQLLADAQKQADEIVAAGKAAVEIERQNKLREADAQATALARSMCEKLLKHNLTAQDDDQLLDDLLQKAGAGNGN